MKQYATAVDVESVLMAARAVQMYDIETDAKNSYSGDECLDRVRSLIEQLKNVDAAMVAAGWEHITQGEQNDKARG